MEAPACPRRSRSTDGEKKASWTAAPPRAGPNAVFDRHHVLACSCTPRAGPNGHDPASLDPHQQPSAPPEDVRATLFAGVGHPVMAVDLRNRDKTRRNARSKLPWARPQSLLVAFLPLYRSKSAQKRQEQNPEQPSDRAFRRVLTRFPRATSRRGRLRRPGASRFGPGRANAPQSPEPPCVARSRRRIEPGPTSARRPSPRPMSDRRRMTRLPKSAKAKRVQKRQTPTGAKLQTADTPPMLASAASAPGQGTEKDGLRTRLRRRRTAGGTRGRKTKMRRGVTPIRKSQSPRHQCSANRQKHSSTT